MAHGRLEAARRADSGEAVKAAAAGLPVAVADYLAGAAEYHADRLDAAMAFFQAIDRLPAEQRNIRTVWAAYMRGRVHQIDQLRSAGEFEDVGSGSVDGVETRRLRASEP